MNELGLVRPKTDGALSLRYIHRGAGLLQGSSPL